MRFLPQLFENNRAWAAGQTLRDPRFFERLCAIQKPEHLWIGCADSRVPANEIVGLAPGELFVHRNIANLVRPDDANCMSVLQYAVDVLGVGHVIVCGHHHCGGVQAACGAPVAQPLEGWIAPLRGLRQARLEELRACADPEEQGRLLCEWNVAAQVRTLGGLPTVRAAWERGQRLALHGWIYDLRDGLLRDLSVSMDRPED